MDKTINGFPSDFIPDTEKETPKYAIQWAKAIWNDTDKGYSGQLGSQVQRFIELRRRAGGFTPIDDFKGIIASTGNTAYLNLNWAVNDPIKSIVQELVGGFTNREYKPQADTIDSQSATEYKEKRNELLFKKALAQKADEIKQTTGIDVLSEDDTEVFETVEEIDLHMAMNVKSSNALGMELLLENTLQKNKKQKLIRSIYKDLVVLGKSAVRIYYDQEYNIKWRMVDPVNLVTSFTKEEDFDDLKYVGEIIQVPIHELAETGQFSEEELFDMAKKAAGLNGNPDWQNGWGKRYHASVFESGAPYKSFKVRVLDCQWFSTNYFTYSVLQKGSKRYFKKERFNYQQSPEARNKKEILRKEPRCVYQAKWIIDTDYVYDYGRKKSEPRKTVDGKMLLDTYLDFVIYQPDMYDMDSKSLVELIIPYADQMCLIQLKIQQHYAQSRPSGSAIDVGGMSNLINGMGDLANNVSDIKALYDQTGDMWYSSVDEDGKFIGNQQPIRPLTPDLSPITNMIEAHEFYKSLIREVIGIAQSRSPVMMDKKVAVGEAQMALSASYNATRYIEQSFENIMNKGIELSSLMIQDNIRYHGKKKEYSAVIGSSFIDSMDIVAKIPLCEFGTHLYISPDDKELMYLEQNIQNSLAAGLIKQSDAMVVRRISKVNPELAERYMVVFEKRYEQDKMQQATAASQAQAEAQAQSNALMEQQKQATLALEWDRKDSHIQLEYKLKKELLLLERQADMREQLVEGDQKIEQIQEAGKLAENQEKAKSDSSEAIQGSFPKASGIRQPKVAQGGV